MKANHIDIKDLLPQNQSIIIAPLCWGLGHSTRSIPIIKEAISLGNKVTIASDGEALALLKGEFPNLDFCELQGYNVRYPYKSIFLNIFLQFFKILKAYISEKTKMAKLVKSVNANMIISDNRYGCFAKTTKNIFITHQLSIHHNQRWLSHFASLINRIALSSFDEIWVPDDKNHTYAGALSTTTASSLLNKVKYIGPISRLTIGQHKPNESSTKKILILLSGPEPQRSYLELAIFEAIKFTTYEYLIIRGSTQEAKVDYSLLANAKVIQFANSETVQDAINSSHLIITRSGYTTIMDLANYPGKVILIPTPGQTEQEYLADYHTRNDKYYHLTQKDVTSKLRSLMEECIK